MSEGRQSSLSSSARHTLLPHFPQPRATSLPVPQHLLLVSGWPVDSFLFRSGAEVRRLREGWGKP